MIDFVNRTSRIGCNYTIVDNKCRSIVSGIYRNRNAAIRRGAVPCDRTKLRRSKRTIVYTNVINPAVKIVVFDGICVCTDTGKTLMDVSDRTRVTATSDPHTIHVENLLICTVVKRHCNVTPTSPHQRLTTSIYKLETTAILKGKGQFTVCCETKISGTTQCHDSATTGVNSIGIYPCRQCQARGRSIERRNFNEVVSPVKLKYLTSNAIGYRDGITAKRTILNQPHSGVVRIARKLIVPLQVSAK